MKKMCKNFVYNTTIVTVQLQRFVFQLLYLTMEFHNTLTFQRCEQFMKMTIYYFETHPQMLCGLSTQSMIFTFFRCFMEISISVEKVHSVTFA